MSAPSPVRRARRAAAAIVAVVAVAGCGNSADPDTWSEAEERGFTDSETGMSYGSAVEFNFMTSCLLANREDSGGNLNAEEALVLCRCDFNGLRENLTLQEFKALDRALRSTPNPSDLDDEPEDVWDDRVEGILDACARRVDV